MKIMNKIKKGLILRIERTSIHDGQGLRTVVFFKGCPLRCQWCSTPESHNMRIEKGYLPNRCIGCGICIESCPEDALSMDNGKILISDEKCKMSLLCYDKCPQSAYKKYGNYMSADELLKEIAKDEIFYYHSNGGVTFSGGEPLMQPDFLTEIMKLCKQRGIHTAMETSLLAPFKDIEKILPYLDVLYTDIKFMDRNKHKEYTGAVNDLIIENILKIDSSSYPVEIYIRIPLIPGINDSRENLLSILDFCKDIKKIQEFELLPYHRLGIETYKHLGLLYKLPDIAIPTPDRIRELKDFVSAHSRGIKIRTGGGLS